MRKRVFQLIAALGILLVVANVATAARVAATVPAGFEDALVTVVPDPTAIAFISPTRMLITSQSGQLWVYQDGARLPNPALNLTIADKVCANSERGLLGVAVDPDFANTKYIYLYYTFKKFGVCPTNDPTNPQVPVNRVSRFVLSDANVASSETVLVDNMLSANGNHNGGDVHFGSDGYLYISVGDGGADYAGDSGSAGSNDATRDQFILLGKILRITRDGAIPPDNPFEGAGTARCYDPAPGGNTTGRNADGSKCQETFAWGFRNPFRFAFKPGASQFFVNDVGQSAWEEIDQSQSGADYGWNCREGKHTNSSSGKCNPAPSNMIDPLFEYAHGANPAPSPFQGCNSITGGAFVPPGVWPATFEGAYLFADYVCGKIFKLGSTGGQYSASEFVGSMGVQSATSLTFGPYNTTQALYYTTYASGGQIRRIISTAVVNPAQDKFNYLPLIKR